MSGDSRPTSTIYEPINLYHNNLAKISTTTFDRLLCTNEPNWRSLIGPEASGWRRPTRWEPLLISLFATIPKGFVRIRRSCRACTYAFGQAAGEECSWCADRFSTAWSKRHISQVGSVRHRAKEWWVNFGNQIRFNPLGLIELAMTGTAP